MVDGVGMSWFAYMVKSIVIKKAFLMIFNGSESFLTLEDRLTVFLSLGNPCWWHRKRTLLAYLNHGQVNFRQNRKKSLNFQVQIFLDRKKYVVWARKNGNRSNRFVSQMAYLVRDEHTINVKLWRQKLNFLSCE